MTGSTRMRFPGISSRAFEHPTDRGALVLLRAVPGFDAVLKAVAGAFNDRAERLLYLSSAVRVGPGQYPELAQLRDECVSTLDLPDIPELFVFRSAEANAMAIGMDRPFIALSSGMVGLLDLDGLRFVIGHEMGHVLSGHAVYRTMLIRLVRLTQSMAWLPIGYWGLRAIVAALREWFRKSELSCDRAGLLCGQDPQAALRAQVQLSGALDPDRVHVPSFLRQAHEYDAVPDIRDSVLKLLQSVDSPYPMPVVRAAELQKWAASDGYRAILSGDYPRRSQDRDVKFTDEARAAAANYRDGLRDSADPLAKVVTSLGTTLADTAGSVRRWFTPEPDPRDPDASPPADTPPDQDQPSRPT
ncbi:MAG TPA: M48 family metallopeptidase [Actinoplanes sp.]|nr:M48 family metallopeptidase [Actinoplanes sp.]